MKTHINKIAIAQGELSVVMAEMCNDIVRHSCQTAKALRDRGINTLLINCATSNGRFHTASDAILHPEAYKGNTHVKIRSVVKGNLYAENDTIDRITVQRNINVVIICGWEWTADNYRRKKSLISFLRQLMEDREVAIIIYSQASTQPVAGKNDRGGLGWIASLAIFIVRIDPSGEPADWLPKPPLLVVDPQEWQQAEESAKLLSSLVTTYDENSAKAEEAWDD